MAAIVRVSVLVALLAATCSDAFLTSLIKNKPTKFTHLQVTLPDPTRPFEFKYWLNKVPLTQDQAQKENWSSLSTECTNGGKFNGFRFTPPVAPSIAALYDSAGVVIGFQAFYDSDKVENGSSHKDCKTKGLFTNTYDFKSQPMIQLETINGVEYKVLTAYFADPATICSSTRDSSKVATDGYANELYFQNGPTPSDLIKVPATRPEASAEGWTDNACLPLNGYHNFWHTEEWDNTQCNNVRPSWIFYDADKKLSGFGFTIPGCDDSPRFQHPPGAIVKQVSGSKCAEQVANTVKFSNINVYFVDPLETLGTCKIVAGLIQKVFGFFG